jgi:hypothetical protein
MGTTGTAFAARRRPFQSLAPVCGILLVVASGCSDQPAGGTRSAAGEFPAFFDDRDNPVAVDFPRGTRRDMTPPPPPMTRFGAQLLELCGSLGDPVSADAFRALLERRENERLLADLSRELAPGGGDVATRLTALWFKRDGFRHIFCGEPGPGGMSGLHYQGRYLQMQDRGWGGPLPVGEGIEEIVPGVIYTLGIQYRWHDRIVGTRIKGYAYGLEAEELLRNATRAHRQLGARSGKVSCLYAVPRRVGRNAFKAVFVARDGAIRTFYPDATPDRRLPKCSSGKPGR